MCFKNQTIVDVLKSLPIKLAPNSPSYKPILGAKWFYSVVLNYSLAYSSCIHAQFLAVKIFARRELQKEKHAEEISDCTACMETFQGLNRDSEKNVDSGINPISLPVPHCSLIMYISRTKQIADKMKTIKMNSELGFPNKKCRRPLHHCLARGLQYFPLTYE